MKEKLHLIVIVFLLLISSNTLFSQLNDTTMCNTIQGCGPWRIEHVQVPIKFPNPQSPPIPPMLDCGTVTVGYYRRECPGGVVQVQPYRVHLPENLDCWWYFNQFVVAYNALDMVEYQRLGEQLWEDVIGDYFLEAVFEEEYKNSGYNSSYQCPNTKTWKVSVPACKALCNVFYKDQMSADYSAVETIWMTCGNSCCETTYSICYNTSLLKVVKAITNVTKIGNCEKNAVPDDSYDHCISSGGFQIKGNHFECKDYCETTFQLNNDHDNSNNGERLLSLNNGVLKTSTLLDEINNITNLVVSTNIIKFQKRNDLKSVKILDLNGLLLKQVEIQNLETNAYFFISVDELVNGLYQIQFESSSKILSKQLLLHR